MYPGDIATLLPIWLCVAEAGTPAPKPILRLRRKAVPKGLAGSDRKVVEPLQFMPMMACVFRGQQSLWPVFCTPPVPPNALQRTQLGQISQYNGG